MVIRGAGCRGAGVSSREPGLVEATLAARFNGAKPRRWIGDRVYDRDPLGEALARQGIERMAPYRRKQRKKPQAGHKLRRPWRRWKVARWFAWLGHFRRIAMHRERYAENYLGFVLLGCPMIFLRTFFG